MSSSDIVVIVSGFLCLLFLLYIIFVKHVLRP